MKKLKILLLIIMFIPIKISALDSNRVYDYAQVILDSEEEKLNNYIETFKSKNNIDIIIVTARHNGNIETKEYAKEFYQKYEFGINEDKSGIMLVIDFNNNKTNIEIYTQGRADEIYNKYINDMLSTIILNDDYYKMSKDFIDLSDKYINGKSSIKNILFDVNLIYILIISIITSSIVILVLFMISRNKDKNKLLYSYLKEGTLEINSTNEKFMTTSTELYRKS